jgi:NDP-sugar pyrophosphorylase family protein
MKAILLAGGQGTRLRPLTLNRPKPIVPIFDRPFLRYQIDLLRRAKGIDEIVLSLNYQPHRIEEVFGDGSALGIRLRYVVEPTPLGTGGAIKFAAGDAGGEPIVVFNGDVFTSIDLDAIIRLHRERKARATIVLTPVENPTAYGLVETDAAGNVVNFLEKPKPDEIRCNTINAGIYVLEPDTLDRIPKDTVYSIERGYFPSLVASGETFVAHIDRGYWIDIGSPDNYRQAHRDIMDGRYAAPPFEGARDNRCVSPSARIAHDVRIEGPCFIDRGAVIGSGAHIGPYSVVGHDCDVGERTALDAAILWPETRVGADSRLGPIVAGRACQIGANVQMRGGVLGDGSIVTDYTRI